MVTGRALCHRGLESAPRISPDTQVLPAADRAAQVLAAIPPLGCSAPHSLCGLGPASPRVWGREEPARAALVLTVREGAPSCHPGPLSRACPRRLLPRWGASHPVDPGLGGTTGQRGRCVKPWPAFEAWRGPGAWPRTLGPELCGGLADGASASLCARLRVAR